MAPTRGINGHTCCVPGCNNNTAKNKEVSWHKFPQDTAMRKIWLKRINRRGNEGKYSLWKPKPSHRVCGAHFSMTGRRAYEDKVPRFFPTRTCPPWTCNPPRQQRQQHKPVQATKTRLPEEPLLLPELDVGSMVTVGSPATMDMPAAVRKPSHAEDQHIDHQYAVRQTSPRKAVSKQKRLIAQLLETSSQLHSEVEKLRGEKENLEEKTKKLEYKLAKIQAQSLRTKPVACKQRSLEILSSTKDVRFYTGFESADRFMVFFSFVENGLGAYRSNGGYSIPIAMHVMDQLMLVLIRLRICLLEQDLAQRFSTSVSSVSRIIIFWTEFLAAYLQQVPYWPSRAVVDRFMPQEFKDLYPRTRVILDCTEIFIETPSDYATQSATYSSYKSHNTAKGLLGISPNGMVTFVGDLAPGRLSDKEITQRSGLYKLLESGDSVMADRGFLIESDLAEIGVTLNSPPFLKGRPQLTKAEEKETRQIAKVRINIERVIGQIKTFRILKGTVPNTMTPRLNEVWKLCTLLYNYCNEPLLDRRRES